MNDGALSPSSMRPHLLSNNEPTLFPTYQSCEEALPPKEDPKLKFKQPIKALFKVEKMAKGAIKD